MIKQEIRSVVRNLLPKIDQTNKYQDRFLDACIEKVLAQWYNYIFTIDPLSLQRYCKRYGGTTTITVSQDLNANIYYSTYPATFIPFPDKASGVRRITTRQQGGIAFYPMDEREVELASGGSYFNSLTSKIGYVVTQDRIEFYKMTAAVAATGVRMDIVIPFSVYAETDTVLIPEMQDDQGNTFFDAVLKMLSIIQPPDTRDDNADTAKPKEQ